MSSFESTAILELPASVDRRTLLALVEASRTMNADLGVPQIFDHIAEKAAHVLNAEGASVMLLDQNKKELVFATVTGPAGAQLEGTRMDAEQGIAGQTIRTRRAVRVDDVEQNRNFFDGIDRKSNIRTRSLIAAPLLYRDEVLGVVEVINPSNEEQFSDEDLELLKIFANLAAAAMVNARTIDRVQRDNRGLRTAVPPVKVIGESPALQQVLRLCEKVAAAPTTVLISGPTGAGKEMAARTVHQCSNRADRPFIAVNCAAIPENLLESELFGHEKGAFTGATDRKLGRFELANGGTLFLDEVGETSASAQTKLLRVLQEREFTRVGGTETLSCDVRIIAATNRDLLQEVQQGRFREDLYYRLNIFPVQMPSLAERQQDISLLVDHFLRSISPELGIVPPIVSDEAMAAMTAYHWPGNIRELRNVVERCALLADGEIKMSDLPREIAAPGSMPDLRPPVTTGLSPATDAVPQAAQTVATSSRPAPQFESKLAEQEYRMLLDALTTTGWNQSAAARQLGVSRDHLRYRIKKYNLKKPN